MCAGYVQRMEVDLASISQGTLLARVLSLKRYRHVWQRLALGKVSLLGKILEFEDGRVQRRLAAYPPVGTLFRDELVPHLQDESGVEGERLGIRIGGLRREGGRREGGVREGGVRDA